MATHTHFPQNIYKADIVHELPYFRSDVIDPKNHFEFVRNYTHKNPHPAFPGRWGWGHFPNGYGYGNFNLHGNCHVCEDPEPQGFVSEKTQKVIDHFAKSSHYR